MLLSRPIFIIGCNRSGTTLLFRNLSEHPRLWSMYIEAQEVFYRYFPRDDRLGDRVTDGMGSRGYARAIERELFRLSNNKEAFLNHRVLRYVPRKFLQRPVGRLYRVPPIRLVEKTPANSMRIPWLARAFPQARFVYITRRPEPTISSLMEGWKLWNHQGADEPFRFRKWHYLAPPGWRDWTARSLAEICAFQWTESNRIALEDLESHAPDRFIRIRHEDLLKDPAGMYAMIAAFCDLEWDAQLDRVILGTDSRVFTTGGSLPRPGKWKELHGAEIEAVRPMFEAMQSRLYDRVVQAAMSDAGVRSA